MPKQQAPGQKRNVAQRAKPRPPKVGPKKRVDKALEALASKRHGTKKQDQMDVTRKRRKHKHAVADQRMGLQAEARQRNRAKGAKSKSNLARHAKLTD